MTRRYEEEFHCPNCKTWHTRETEFGRWIRNNPELDSRKHGMCVVDVDYVLHTEKKWIHKYRNNESRCIQCIMYIEIKTRGADLTDSQRDTWFVINQFFRNRKQTPTKDLKWQSGNGVLKVFSSMQKKWISVRTLGAHVLRFSGLGPDDSEWIVWDKICITKNQLTGLLRFDLDPDTLCELDLRRHHSKPPQIPGLVVTS